MLVTRRADCCESYHHPLNKSFTTTVVSHAYHDAAPFAFTGQIKEVAIEVSPTQPLIKE
jgi:hypothetical protein